MTLTRVESDFGNSSCSSMASFMSGLLQENFGKSELTPDHIQINIVNDNAKVETSHIGGIHKCRSLVTMRRQRSGRQLSRWSNMYQPRDSDPNLMTLGTRRAPRGQGGSGGGGGGGGGGLRHSMSDTLLLTNRPVTREPSRVSTRNKTTNNNGSATDRSGNATWSNADVQESSLRAQRSPMFNLSMDLSPVDDRKNQRVNPFLDQLVTLPFDRSSFYSENNKDLLGDEIAEKQTNRKTQDPLVIGLPKPVRRPSMQNSGCTLLDKSVDLPEDVAPDSRRKMNYDELSLQDLVVQQALDSVTLFGSSSCSKINTIRDPTILGVNMPNRKSRKDSSRNNHLLVERESSSSKSSSSSSSSGMRRKSYSHGSSLATFQQSLQRSSSKTKEKRKYLTDPSLLGLNVKIGSH